MPITKAQCEIINRAYMDMPELHHSFTDCKIRLRHLCTEEERQHRRMNEDAPYHSLVTIPLAAKYFAVKWLADEVLRPRLEVKDYLSVKESAFYAAAIAADVRDTPKCVELIKWAQAIPKEFWDLDYAKMVRP